MSFKHSDILNGQSETCFNDDDSTMISPRWPRGDAGIGGKLYYACRAITSERGVGNERKHILWNRMASCEARHRNRSGSVRSRCARGLRGEFRAIHGVKRRFFGGVVSSIFLCDYIVGVFIGGLARLGCAADP